MPDDRFRTGNLPWSNHDAYTSFLVVLTNHGVLCLEQHVAALAREVIFCRDICAPLPLSANQPI